MIFSSYFPPKFYYYYVNKVSWLIPKSDLTPSPNLLNGFCQISVFTVAGTAKDFHSIPYIYHKTLKFILYNVNDYL